jgi:hypothetical protein
MNLLKKIEKNKLKKKSHLIEITSIKRLTASFWIKNLLFPKSADLINP